MDLCPVIALLIALIPLTAATSREDLKQHCQGGKVKYYLDSYYPRCCPCSPCIHAPADPQMMCHGNGEDVCSSHMQECIDIPEDGNTISRKPVPTSTKSLNSTVKETRTSLTRTETPSETTIMISKPQGQTVHTVVIAIIVASVCITIIVLLWKIKKFKCIPRRIQTTFSKLTSNFCKEMDKNNRHETVEVIGHDGSVQSSKLLGTQVSVDSESSVRVEEMQVSENSPQDAGNKPKHNSDSVTEISTELKTEESEFNKMIPSSGLSSDEDPQEMMIQQNILGHAPSFNPSFPTSINRAPDLAQPFVINRGVGNINIRDINITINQGQSAAHGVNGAIINGSQRGENFEPDSFSRGDYGAPSDSRHRGPQEGGLSPQTLLRPCHPVSNNNNEMVTNVAQSHDGAVRLQREDQFRKPYSARQCEETVVSQVYQRDPHFHDHGHHGNTSAWNRSPRESVLPERDPRQMRRQSSNISSMSTTGAVENDISANSTYPASQRSFTSPMQESSAPRQPPMVSRYCWTPNVQHNPSQMHRDFWDDSSDIYSGSAQDSQNMSVSIRRPPCDGGSHT